MVSTYSLQNIFQSSSLYQELHCFVISHTKYNPWEFTLCEEHKQIRFALLLVGEEPAVMEVVEIKKDKDSQSKIFRSILRRP